MLVIEGRTDPGHFGAMDEPQAATEPLIENPCGGPTAPAWNALPPDAVAPVEIALVETDAVDHQPPQYRVVATNARPCRASQPGQGPTRADMDHVGVLGPCPGQKAGHVVARPGGQQIEERQSHGGALECKAVQLTRHALYIVRQSRGPAGGHNAVVTKEKGATRRLQSAPRHRIAAVKAAAIEIGRCGRNSQNKSSRRRQRACGRQGRGRQHLGRSSVHSSRRPPESLNIAVAPVTVTMKELSLDNLSK